MAELLTRKEASALFKVSLVTLHAWHKAGKLPYIRLGKRLVRISADDVRRLLAESKN